MKKSALYTRTGDQGTTSLVGGTRVSKASTKISSYGTIDELNSHLGLLLTEVSHSTLREQLIRCQQNLFHIGALLATEPSSQSQTFPAKEVETIEQHIDALHDGLPPWRGFTLPGGCKAAALAHVCRTICRRAEREIYALAQEEEVDELLKAYINRLSDYLYILAVRLNFLSDTEEILWKKNCEK